MPMSQQTSGVPQQSLIAATGPAVLLEGFPTVMRPSPYTLALADQLRPAHVAHALDMGCGSGFLAILLALQGAQQVWAVDRDDAAVAATAHNAKLNHVAEHIHVTRSDLFSAIPRDMRFDLIVANPPATPAWQSIPHYNQAGSDGRLVIDRLIAQAPAHLEPSGRLLFAHSSRLSWDLTTALLTQHSYRYQILHRQEVPSRPEYYQRYPEYYAELEKRGAVVHKEGAYYEAVAIVSAQPRSV